MQLPPQNEVSLEKNANFTKLNTPKSGFSRSFHWITAAFKSRTCLWWSVIGIHAEDLGGHRLNEFGRCWRWLLGRQSAWQKESCGAFTWLGKKKKKEQFHRGAFGWENTCCLDKLKYASTGKCGNLLQKLLWKRSCPSFYLLLHQGKENKTIVITTQPSSRRHTHFWL